jgi:AmmeMemoRadiSam system protein B/AmmeMemoRadiSam system protein A
MMHSKIPEKNVRQPVVAGSFYTANAEVLSQEIDHYLKNVPSEDAFEKPLGLIAPHAGYMYSGQVAAYAYKKVEGGTFDGVVVLAPSHRAYFSGASVDDKEGFRTPLGVVPVNRDMAQQIGSRSPLITHYEPAHTQEHSLEVQVPFLQKALKEFTLIPIVMGDQDLTTAEKIAQAVADVIKGHNVLVVASSDLSHFHPYDEAKELDQKVIDYINQYDPQGLASDLRLHKTEACGGGPIITALLIGQHLGADRATVIHYANSGDVTGDHSGVVGYAAGIIYKSDGRKADKKGGRKAGIDLGLKEDEKKHLHHMVKETIKSRLAGKSPPDFKVDSQTLKELRGAFVSLHKEGILRGCIGHIKADRPLDEIIKKMSVAAAFEDPRFPPLTREEFDKVDIEISVLTPFKRISDIDEIEVGKHGLYMVKGFYLGILLPQVATEYGWDRVSFLEHTCTKAGLPKNAWKENDTEIYIFSADVF